MRARIARASACVGLAFAMVLSGCMAGQALREEATPVTYYFATMSDYVVAKGAAANYVQSMTADPGTVSVIRALVKAGDKTVAKVQALRMLGSATEYDYYDAAAHLRQMTSLLYAQVGRGAIP